MIGRRRSRAVLRWLARLGLGLGLVTTLTSCPVLGSVPAVVAPVVSAHAGDSRIRSDIRPALLRRSVSGAAQNRGSVRVRHVREPGDFAHRNYCGPGATQVLLSAWLPAVPDLELIALRSKLNPKLGESGPDALIAINSFLDPIVIPVLGRPRYRPERVTTLTGVEDRIRHDILDGDAIRLFGHGAPVLVQTMTGTMPGWNHWNATHMITIFAFDFSHKNPALDTVTYVDTSSRLTGYAGRGVETISVKALWTAMHAFLVQAPYDPVNVIS